MKEHLTSHHRQLLKTLELELAALNDEIPRKRRRRNQQTRDTLILQQPSQVININSSESEADDDENEDNNDEIDDEDDDDEFEDVDLSANTIDFNKAQSASIMEPLVIPLKKPSSPEPVKKRNFRPITKEQRELRRVMHCQCVALMMVHGAIRNCWCNDYKLMQTMKKVVPQSVSNLLLANTGNELTIVKSRRFLDGLRKLMNIFQNKFRVTNQGFILKNWHELKDKQPRVDPNITQAKFQYLLKNFRGSRDIAAQAFVCILRSLGVTTRLIFSLQPPDYTSISDTLVLKSVSNDQTEPEMTRKLLNTKQNLLNNIRANSNRSNKDKTDKQIVDFQDSDFPIFWVEVWDKYSEKWVSIDPIVMKLIEVAPMRRKSKFEPPSSDNRNQLTYVIAYDTFGVVSDVTRRYAHYYNAKTIKKRIEFKSDEYKIWYERLIGAFNSKIKLRKTRRDVLEMKEFHDRDLAEGMPNNVADFKNHPTYALESQLKQNEVIYPNDLTSKCGMFRHRGKSKSKDVINVFKRSHVYTLRLAKAWYMRGRILKIGVQPLKIKKLNSTPDETNEEEDTRLYAEFQTSIFIPPPIIDGKIPKNVYGNIDCYQPHMIPENGYLIPVESYPIKISEKAARILDIDYAKAITAFDFSNRRNNRVPNAKEGGILVESKYKEAMLLICAQLIEDQLQYDREQRELQSLKLWKYFLTKLRISDRLNTEHGEVEEEKDEDSAYLSLESNFSNSDIEPNSIDSGFKRNMNDDQRKVTKQVWFERNQENEEEGFKVLLDKDTRDDDEDDNDYTSGGFSREFELAEIEEVDEGGFIKTDNLVEMDSIGNEYEGGFFVGDNHEIQNLVDVEDSNYENNNFKRELSEELPDSLFRYNEKGELLYDPQGDNLDVSNNNAEDDRPRSGSPIEIFDKTSCSDDEDVILITYKKSGVQADTNSEKNPVKLSSTQLQTELQTQFQTQSETQLQTQSETQSEPLLITQSESQPINQSPASLKVTGVIVEEKASTPQSSVSDDKELELDTEPAVISSLLSELSDDEKEFAFEYDSD